VPREAAQYVAAEIRAELARRKMSIRGFAETLGVNHLWVNRRISTMTTEMSPDDIEFMADGLGLPVWKLVPRKWLPRLDSNQQPFGKPVRERSTAHLRLVQ
jgi:hypothetical protein